MHNLRLSEAGVPPTELSEKPKVSVAVLCDEVVQGEDGAVSLIRIVNTFTADLDSADANNPVRIEIQGLVSLRDVFGDHTITIRCRNPVGRESNPQDLIVRAPPRTPQLHSTIVNVKLQLPIVTYQIGSYSLDVYFDGEPLVDIPFTIKQQSSHEQRTGTEESPS